MLRIGLTGGIGSGKTTVAKIFELLGIPVYYADLASKRLYETDANLIASIKENFGEGVYSGNKLNRSLLATIIFNDPDKLELLNQLVHPPTIRDAEDWMKKQERDKSSFPYIVKEAALIFESGSAKGLDFVIGVHTPLALRIKRVMDRDGISREDVLKRMNNQIDENLKMRLCDFVIINDEQELIIPQILELHKKFLALLSKN